MKKFTPFILIALMIASCMVSQARPSDPDENEDAVPADSSVSVIAWFSKRDTLDYWIYQGEWKVNGQDTIRTMGINTKVRIVVTDSTSNGYNMDYTFLEMNADTIENAPMSNFQNVIVEKLGQKIIGTTIQFESDEYRSITKFNNLDQIKERAESLFKEAMNELLSMPEMKLAKAFGIDISKISKLIDINQLVDSYLQELKWLFIRHGSTYRTGKICEHNEATETMYENDKCTKVGVDSENGTYFIATQAENIVPPSNMKNILGNIVDNIMDDEELAETVTNGLDSHIKLIGIVSSYFRTKFLIDGWPYSVLRQDEAMIGDQGKLKQTSINLCYYSVRNYKR